MANTEDRGSRTRLTQERWATTGTGAVVVATMSATWLLCEGFLAWRDTFRIEDLAAAYGQAGDFETYRPEGAFESGTVWTALVITLTAVVLAVVAGVRSGRWRPVVATASAVCVMVVVAAGTVLPFGPFLLLVGAIPATLAVRSLSRPARPARQAGAGIGAG